jgi:PAS domain S-box-containing protein
MEQLKILILEDQDTDAELLKYHASLVDYDCDFRRAVSEKSLKKALSEFEPDIILSDYKLDGYDGLRALEYCSEKFPHVPFIIITGTLGEELAVEIIKKGASDFILKGKISELPVSIIRALREVREKREKVKAEQERDKLFTLSIDMIGIASLDGFFKTINPAFEKTLGYSNEEFLSRPFMEFIHPDDIDLTTLEVTKLSKGFAIVSFTNRYRCKNGEYKWLEWNAVPHGQMLFVSARDITERVKDKNEILELNQHLEHKVEERTRALEEKNKKITDSINYAKRIQHAKLPSKELIYSHFPESFILFKPKDIVSGDFYFFYEKANTIFIASADCTGHGVPGALMSMLGSEILSKVVEHYSNPSEILTHLNKEIKNSLKQTDDNQSTRDGMDIALCAIDKTTRTITYAGANRPIWIIRNGNAMVEEIKATIHAIGGFTSDNQHFNNHEIKLSPGDAFYTFTDGYADQFGGRNGKKLTTKKFKEILLDIQSKKMPDQENYLNEFVENWKAGEEQIDDILVFGVRL